MANKDSRKKRRAVSKLLDILQGDGLSVEASDEERSGKAAVGDINLQFKRRKYPITVERKESIPNATLEEERGDSDILMFRKNRESWKVYMDMNTLILLLLNERS